MSQKRITWLTILIAIALIGLIVLQFVWIKNTLQLRQDQFHQAIKTSIADVADRAERAAVFKVIAEDDRGRKLLENNFLNVDLEDETIQDKYLSLTTRDPLNRRRASEMIENLIASNALRPLHDRIDMPLVDSLLREELESRNIGAEYCWGIYDSSGRQKLVQAEVSSKDSLNLKNTYYKTQLSKSDIFNEPHFLHVWIPDPQLAIWATLWPILLVSGLFLSMVIVGVAHIMSALLRQKRVSQIKDDLVNNLTHELKTPISTISLACEALVDPSINSSPEQVDSFIGMIKAENKRLGVLVDNVLRSAVLDSGEMKLKFVSIDINDLLAELVKNTKIQTERVGGSLTFERTATLARVAGDRTHLTNIFLNLIDNGLKYCDGPPHILVSTRNEKDDVIVTVKDNGIGIAKEEQSRIFERLYRVPTGNVHNVKGFGLGLSYVKIVVERHEGTISVVSTPGNGSEFSVYIPLENE